MQRESAGAPSMMKMNGSGTMGQKMAQASRSCDENLMERSV